jgi:radical SAM protein with 4Fe4S-binding SPASM domain
MDLQLPSPYTLTAHDMDQPIVSREEARQRVIERPPAPAASNNQAGSTKPSEECGLQDPSPIQRPETLRARNARIVPGGTVSCPYAWRELWIHHQGTVSCCDTNNFPLPMGEVPRDRITDLWNNETYQQLRRRLRNGEVYAACRHCHVTGQTEHPEDPLSFVKEA